MRIKGKVKRYSDFNGYGFVIGEDGIDYFIHISNIEMDGYKALCAGQHVEFTPVVTAKGVQAYELVVIANEQQNNDTETEIRDNPFSPQKPILNPRKFAGRRQETILAIKALHNKSNVLVFGPRGIGKSSFARQITLVNEGKTDLLDKLGISITNFRNNFLTCDYSCQKDDSLQVIVNNLLSILHFKLTGERLPFEQRKAVSHSIGDSCVSVDRVETNKSDSELASTFRMCISNLFKDGAHACSGITFFVDEIDTLDSNVDLVTFIKSVTEAAHVGTQVHFIFVLCGVAGAYTNFLAQHPSSARLFEPIQLTQFKNSEIHEMLSLSLQGSGYTISPDASTLICQLSNRFPHPVHQLGYYAFDNATRKTISINDVDEAKRIITTRIKEQEFHNRLTEESTSPSLQLLQTLASFSEDSVTIADIEKKLPSFGIRKILGSFSPLLEREYIDREGNKYRFREPLFKIYIRWAFNLA